jgi:hypothetical protein
LGGLFAFGIWDLLLLPQERQEVITGKSRLQLDLAHLKGSEIPFHRMLMVVGGCCTSGEVGLGRIFVRNI